MNISTTELLNILSTFIHSFSNRELSVIIWIILFILCQMKSITFRRCILNVIKLLFSKKIFSSLLFCYLYMIGYVYILYKYGFMHSYLLKDFIFWCVLVPIPSIIGYVSGKKTDFFKFALSNGTVVALILALQSYYTFSFIIEFISFPILCFVAALSAYANTEKEKYGVVNKIIETLFFIVGSFLLAYAIYQALNDLDGLGKNHFIHSFLFNETLYIVFTPFLYLYCVVAAYDEWFTLLEFKSSKDNYKSRCAFFVKKCGLNLSKIRYISKHLHVYVPQTEEQLKIDFSEWNQKYHSKYD